MKTYSSLFVFCIALSLFYGCKSPHPKNESTSETISSEVDSTNKAAKNMATSYEALTLIIKERAAIPCTYTAHTQDNLKCPLTQHLLLQESDKYIVVKSMYQGAAMDAYPYYLCSFSKETGKLISSLSLGQEAEGVEPHEIKWESANRFSLSEYHYELVEDEESGAYTHGALKDSTITHYSINQEGIFSVLAADTIDLTFLKDKRYLTLFESRHSTQSMIIEPACLSTCPTISFEQLSFNNVVFSCGQDGMNYKIKDVKADDLLLVFSLENDLTMKLYLSDTTEYNTIEVSLSNFEQLYMGYYDDSLTSINSEKVALILQNEENITSLKNQGRYSAIPCPEDTFD